MSLAKIALDAAKQDWACFASQQAAEKALKGLYQHHNAEGWGHGLDKLVIEIVDREPDLAVFRVAAKALDKCYIPTRYPNGLPSGAPADAYTEKEARQAIRYAEDIIRFCQARCSA